MNRLMSKVVRCYMSSFRMGGKINSNLPGYDSRDSLASDDVQEFMRSENLATDKHGFHTRILF